MEKINYSYDKSFTIERDLHRNDSVGTRVCVALDDLLRRRVVLKIQKYQSKEEKQRILGEINNQIALEQYTEYIPSIYSYHIENKISSIIIEMQTIEGKTLRDLLDNAQGSNRNEEKWYKDRYELFMKIVRAVSYIHDLKGFVHKDLKPENIVINRRNEIYILDYGISGPGMANKGVGTEKYMAPEQIRGANTNFVLQSSDVFALAQIGLELFNIAPLKYGVDLIPDQTGEKWEDKKDISRVGKDYYPELGKLLEKALSIKPSDRYMNAKELYEALKLGCRAYNRGKFNGKHRNENRR